MPTLHYISKGLGAEEGDSIRGLSDPDTVQLLIELAGLVHTTVDKGIVGWRLK